MKVVRSLLLVLVAGVLLVAAVVLPMLAGGRADDRAAVMGGPNGQPGAIASDGSGDGAVPGVKEFGMQSLRHVPDNVDYELAPPVGGDHADAWLECGVYDEPVREENAVHALEHGTVWITYRPGTPPEAVADLAQALPDEGILSPHPEQSAPVVVTVWATQLELSGPEDPRLDQFLRAYGNGETAPEPMASCHGGVERFESEDSVIA